MSTPQDHPQQRQALAQLREDFDQVREALEDLDEDENREAVTALTVKKLLLWDKIESLELFLAEQKEKKA